MADHRAPEYGTTPQNVNTSILSDDQGRCTDLEILELLRENERSTQRDLIKSQMRPRCQGRGSCRKASPLRNQNLLIFALLLSCMICYILELRPTTHIRSVSGSSTTQQYVPDITLPRLKVIQVTPPVSAPAGESCNSTLMVHVFASSYGRPFVGECIRVS